MIYFFVYLFLEVMISVNLASEIGGFYTFLEILLSALIGMVLLVNFRATLVENMHAVSMQKIDVQEFQRLNIFAVLGAILLILPGFLTDIIGILLQFSVFTKMLVNRFTAKSPFENQDSGNRTYTHTQIHEEKDDNVIDVEIISNDTTK
ncbi:FxsA family protein [Sulfurimonas sp. HSL3-7]|uniref:FxsA family protein n=1 Tax=Sulfonitrofixus jiaomeiensis TaxID=3131938 RepID=UPI0031F98463